MTIPAPAAHAPRWTLPRILILLIAGAFAALAVDIRVEHIDIVRENWMGWIPIIYAFWMAIFSLLAALFWKPRIRKIMLILFLLAFIVGGWGFYLHNDGHFTKVASTSWNAWVDLEMKRYRGPPQVAPFAFAGLGLLGILASLKRFNDPHLLFPPSSEK